MEPKKYIKKNHIEIEKNKKKEVTDFSKVGGLSNHLGVLRDLIIVPLMHNNVFSHFNIKTPRGVLFYGPPGMLFLHNHLD